ncbi:MAG: hypothetical protein ACR2HR_03175 [Euzebya sp.]
MRQTTFAGLTILEPGESLSANGYAFQGKDREAIDHYLRLGALTHRHDGSLALPNPTAPLVGSVDSSGGALPADTTLMLGYTQLDGLSGETALSPVTAFTTPPSIEPPTTSPTAVAQYTAGALLVGTYYYALTFTDAGGGETPPGPSVEVVREPGYASARVSLSGLNQGLPWRLYRAKGGQGFDLLTSGTGDTFVDDGLTPLDCGQAPPGFGENTTNQQSVVNLTLPTVTTDMRVYVSLDGQFTSPALLGLYPAASAGALVSIGLLRADDGSPPAISTAVAGAQKIDPDTDLLEWTWKRPVASVAALPTTGNLEGDVRLVKDLDRLYARKASAWVALTSGGGSSLRVAVGASAVLPTGSLEFVAGPNVSLALSDLGGASARVTVGAGLSRSDVALVVPALAAGASASAVAALGATYKLIKLATNRPARVRLYSRQTKLDADQGRGVGSDPLGNHGVMAEVRTDAANLEWDLSPQADGSRLDINSPNIPVAVTNEDGSAGDVNVTFTIVKIE